MVVFAEHVAMIESYGATKVPPEVSTIDGNIGLRTRDAADNLEASDSVSGYVYTTPNLKTAHGGLKYIWRPSLEAFGATTTGTSSDDTAGNELVSDVEDVCNRVIALYAALQLPGAVSAGSTVAAMAAGSEPKGT